MYDYNSSNAHKLNYYDYKSYDAVRKAPVKKQEKPLAKAEASPKAQPSFFMAAKSFFLVAVCFVVAFFIVRGFVAINEAENRITMLKEELRMIEAENQAIRAKIDKSIDLKNLQSIASEKFGMVRPENYQIFYMDLDSADYSENINDKKDKSEAPEIPVESVTGVLISSTDMFR